MKCETAEEAVVFRQTYVTKEIALRKTGCDRVETIKDTVRKEDVEVDQLPNDTHSVYHEPGQDPDLIRSTGTSTKGAWHHAPFPFLVE